MASSPVRMGIDVSKATLSVAWRDRSGKILTKEFANDTTGHQQIVKLLGSAPSTARVGLEATNVYHLDLALKLHEASAPLMVINPLASRRFAQAMLRRAKTDRVDALLLLEYIERMEFVCWKTPEASVWALRGLARELAALAAERTRHLNRQHKEAATQTTPTFLQEHRKAMLLAIDSQVEWLLGKARELFTLHASLARAAQVLTSIPGIGERAAITLLGELLLLDPEMTPRQLTAYAGLDPRPRESGTSKGRVSISKLGHAAIRRILFLSAMTASTHHPVLRAFKERLVERGKKPLVAIVALMRRMLICSWTMLHRNELFDAGKFTPSYPRS